MFVIQHQIPDLKGRTCTKLMAQQYWYRGKLSSDLNAMFLGLDDSTWHKIFFDSGVLFWKQEPPLFDTSPADEYHYPVVDLSSRFPVLGNQIESILADASATDSALRVIFSGGGVLALHHDVDNDEMDLIYETRPSA